MKSLNHYIMFLIFFFASLIFGIGSYTIASAENNLQYYFGFFLMLIGFLYLMIDAKRKADRVEDANWRKE